jgi:hypothetical protein
MAGSPPPRVVPIPAADALFVDVLRAGLAAYVRGDYSRAANYFQDAAAMAGYRPEAEAWAVLGVQLEHAVLNRDLVSRDVAFQTADEVRA